MKILHLEDSKDDSKLICQALRDEVSDCQVTRVETREAFLEALDHDWDIILADYSLPSFDGISALKLAVERCPDLPFIFVTGALGEERAVETLKNGATDYILKNRLDRLSQAVGRARRESDSAKARKEVEQKLRASLREKELLLQEVHHRVKNNLAVISSLLSMQADKVNDPLLSSALLESQQRIQSMAMIHEMLYAYSGLHDINFGEYSRQLAAQVSSFYGADPARIRLSFDLAPLRLEIDRAIPCGLILNELLSNAFKYAFPAGRSGEVRISLLQQDSGTRMSVEDNGVGLPEGCFPERSRSLGLRIVNILTQQLGGSMDVSSNQGSHFVLRFAHVSGPANAEAHA